MMDHDDDDKEKEGVAIDDSALEGILSDESTEDEEDIEVVKGPDEFGNEPEKEY